MDFTLNIPKNAAEGEYYFAVFAGTKTTDKTVRAASLAYVYVDGGRTHYERAITDISFPTFSLNPVLDYSFSIANKGNIHSEVAARAYLVGLGTHTTSDTTYHIVIPNQSRRAEGVLKAHFLPGLYTVTFESHDSVSNTTTKSSRLFIYIPAWSIALTIVLLLSITWMVQSRSSSRSSDSSVRHTD